MSKSHILSVTIGAALQSGFKSVIGDSTSQISRLGDAIRKMETDSKRINTFRGMSADLGAAKHTWQEAESQVRRLAIGISSTAQPTQDMQREFEKAEFAAGKAKDAFIKKRDALHNVRMEMVSAGQASGGLSMEQIRLGGSIERLKLKYTALNSVITEHKAILAKRSELRGQIADTLALGAAIVAPLHSAAKFETEMYNLKENLVDLPENEHEATKVLDKFGTSLKNLSRTLPFTAEQLVVMAESGGHIGIATDKLGDYINTTAKMAFVYGMSAEDASDAAAKMSAAYKLPVGQLQKLGDVINLLGDTQQAKPGEIFKTMAKSAGAASNFGLSAEHVAALASAFISLGKEPRNASSAITDMLMKLGNAEKQSDQFKKGLSSLGFEASDFKEAIKQDASGALMEFLKAANEAEDKTGILFDMFGGGAADDITLLVDNLDHYKKALNNITDESKRTDAVQHEFESKMKASEAQFQLFTNSLHVLGINIGSVLLPALNSVLGVFGSVLGVVSDSMQKFPILAKVILIPIVSLMALKVASIALVYAWTFVQGGALLVRTALFKMGIEATLAGIKFNSFNAASLITSIRLKALAFGSVIASIWRALGAALVFTTTRLMAFNTVAAITYVRTKALAIGQVLIAVWGMLGNAVSFASARLLTFNAVSLITAARIRLFALGSIIASFAGGLITFASTAIPVVIGGLRALTVALMTNPIGLVIGGIALAAGLIIANWEKVRTFFAGIWEPIKPAWEAFANWIGSFWKIISAPVAAIGKVFEFLFGSNKKLQANITGSQEAANAAETNISSSLPVPEVAGQSFIPGTPEIPATNIAGITPLPNIQNTPVSFASPAAPNQSISESKTIHNNFKIEVNAAPGQDIKSIAEEVMRKIKEMSRGALFDTAGATL